MSEIAMHSVVALLENVLEEGPIRGQVGTIFSSFGKGAD